MGNSSSSEAAEWRHQAERDQVNAHKHVNECLAEHNERACKNFKHGLNVLKKNNWINTTEYDRGSEINDRGNLAKHDWEDRDRW